MQESCQGNKTLLFGINTRGWHHGRVEHRHPPLPLFQSHQADFSVEGAMNGSDGEWERVGPSDDQLSHCLTGSPAGREDFERAVQQGERTSQF